MLYKDTHRRQNITTINFDENMTVTSKEEKVQAVSRKNVSG